MRKAINIVLIFAVIYFLLQFAVTYFLKSHDITYEITNSNITFNVREVFKKVSNDKSYYFFSIKDKKNDYVFVTDNIFNKQKNVISDLKYFKDGKISCVYPIYVKEIDDVVPSCVKSGKNYSISELQDEMDMKKFYEAFPDVSEGLFKDDTSKKETSEKVTYYHSNFNKNEVLTVYQYKKIGMYTKDEHVSYINFSDKDIYENKYSRLVGKYYMAPLFGDSLNIRGYYCVDLTTRIINFYEFNESVSRNMYVQGVVDNKLYILDKSNKKQYALDPVKKSKEEVGSVQSQALLYNGKSFDKVGIQDLVDKETAFIDTDYQDAIKDDYVRAFATEVAYFYYNKDNEFYKIYKDDPTTKIFLFKSDKVKDVAVSGNNLYYIEGNNIYRFNDTGRKTLITYNELSYNNQNIISAYTR